MYIKNLILVVLFLEGKVDIYSDEYYHAVETWNQAWDEMKYLGYNPECPESIMKYLTFEL